MTDDDIPQRPGTLSLGGPLPPPGAGRAPRVKPFRVAGLASVRALFQTDPGRVERLFYEERLRQQVGPFAKEMANLRRPYRMVGEEELEKVAGTKLHGGVVAVAQPRPIQVFTLDAAEQWAREGDPLLLLDGVSNPNNLGAIIRTAAFFGIRRVVLSDHPAQALVSESAYRVAEGGFEHVDLYGANHFPEAVRALNSLYRTVGTALGKHKPLDGLGPQGGKPVAVILGNEEHGMQDATRAACAEVIMIPGSGKVQSLNVSATAAILAFLMTR